MSPRGTTPRGSALLQRAFRVSVSFLILCAAAPAHAGTTGSTALEVVQGSAADRSNGDYVSAKNGLDTVHLYYAEVPPGMMRLDIDVFDADVGMGGNKEGTRDRLRGDSWNTSTRRPRAGAS